ncbi:MULTISPECIES: FkbM family methyltransferase [unclassified Sphingomonas]|uniref:FkbM family methyltransferase n=1 Tax=unclassified Sphingomonas TaxID=196159 RepID=UPI0009E87841|nr:MULTISPECIES: FkbM family methyltransferase [unclassified Sphingomonas]
MSEVSLFKSLSSARFCERTGFSAIDIGARGGVDSAMLPLAWATDMIGFEPEPGEAAALAGRDPAPWRSRTILPVAVGGFDGPATLHIPPSPESASLLPHNQEMIAWFGTSAQHQIDQRIPVDTRSLDGLAAEGALTGCDYLKIDVEGAEGDILSGGAAFLRSCLAIRVETSFLEQRVNQPLAWDIGRQLADAGFLVIDLIGIQHWRNRQRPGFPYSSRAAIPCSRPVIAQADYIAVRDFRSVTDPVMAAKLVLVTAALGYIDMAETMLNHHRSALGELMAETGMNLEADLVAVSQALAKQGPGPAIWQRVRDLVPLGRSLLGGLPAR